MGDKNKITITCVCSPSLGISRSATNENLTITKRIVYFEVYKVLHKDMYKCLDEGQMVEQGQGIFVPVNQRLPFRIKLDNDVKGDVKMKVCSGEGCKIYTSTSGSNEVDADFTMNVENGLRLRNLFLRAEKSGKYAICLEYEHEGKPYSETIKFEVFEIQGPKGVPEYSVYSYKFEGLPESTKWDTQGLNEAKVVKLEEERITIHWGDYSSGDGLALEIDGNFKWYFKIKIAKIELRDQGIHSNDAHFFSESVGSEGIAQKAKIVAFATNVPGTKLHSFACAWEVLLGLSSKNFEEDVLDVVEVGFIQNLKVDKFRAKYDNNKYISLQTPQGEMLEGKIFHDASPGVLKSTPSNKYYYHERERNFSVYPDIKNAAGNFSKEKGKITFRLESNDSPSCMFPEFFLKGEKFQKKLNDSKIEKIEWKLSFNLWIVMRAKNTLDEEKENYYNCYLAKWSVEITQPFPVEKKDEKLENSYDAQVNIVLGNEKIECKKVMNGTCKVSIIQKWENRIKDGGMPDICDNKLYNEFANKCEFKELTVL